MRRLIFFSISAACILVSCRKDKAVEPVTPPAPAPVSLDYRDSVTGTYICEDHWSSTYSWGSSSGIDTATMVITKDTVPNQILIDGTPFPLDSNFYYNGTTGGTIREVRFVINTSNGDSLYFHFGYISPGTQQVHMVYGVK